jgi:HPt (histidine-containing phosphotransfer) domain-containing protein
MINWKQVKQLEQDIGAEDFQEVVEMFLEEVDEAVDNLRPEPELEASDMASALHFLKGSAANLGFQVFADCCSKGEALAEKDQALSVDLKQVIGLYDQSRHAFLADVVVHTSYKV